VRNKDAKQDALDNLADALTEDILNTPDDELLREVEEDYGDPRALANKFDQILERAEKQVFGTARPAASPQVRSSVLDLLISLPDETIRWVKGFDLGSRLSEFLSSLTPRTLAWSATAAAVVILVPAGVMIKVWNEIEQGPPSAQQMAEAPGTLPRAGGKGDRLQMLQKEAPDVAVLLEPPVPPPAQASPQPKVVAPLTEIAALVARGRQLIVAGDIPNARLELQQAAEAGDTTAALELGATYDPIELEQWERGAISAARRSPVDHPISAARRTVTGFPVASTVPSVFVPRDPYGNIESKTLYDIAMARYQNIAMARTWYQKAKDLGSTQAPVRLKNLASRERLQMFQKEEALVARGRQLIVAGDIPNARLELQQAAEAGNATAALLLGATYDPIELEQWERNAISALSPVASTVPSRRFGNIESKALSDIAMARTWYQKAKDLGSTEAQGRLENLAARDQPKR
jgi:TPR repeat protein